MYKYIKNPLTGLNIKTNSLLGKYLIKTYTKHLKGGGSLDYDKSQVRSKIDFESTNATNATKLQILNYFMGEQYDGGGKSLKMIIGSHHNDVRFKGWDIALDTNHTNSDSTLVDPMAVNGDFNNYCKFIYLFKRLEDRYELIAFDFSTVKFLNNYEIIKSILRYALKVGGKLFLPIKTASQTVVEYINDDQKTGLENEGYEFKKLNERWGSYTVNGEGLEKIVTENVLAVGDKTYVVNNNIMYRPDIDFFINKVKEQIIELIELNIRDTETRRKHIIIDEGYPFEPSESRWGQEPYIVIQRI
jgi:hypothetical protein